MIENDSVCLCQTHCVIILPPCLSDSEVRASGMPQLCIRAFAGLCVFICLHCSVGLGLLAECLTMWKWLLAPTLFKRHRGDGERERMRENREGSRHVKKKKTSQRWTTAPVCWKRQQFENGVWGDVSGGRIERCRVGECYSFMAVPVKYQIFGQSQWGEDGGNKVSENKGRGLKCWLVFRSESKDRWREKWEKTRYLAEQHVVILIPLAAARWTEHCTILSLLILPSSSTSLQSQDTLWSLNVFMVSCFLAA